MPPKVNKSQKPTAPPLKLPEPLTSTSSILQVNRVLGAFGVSYILDNWSGDLTTTVVTNAPKTVTALRS